jgi:hypothetical protein
MENMTLLTQAAVTLADIDNLLAQAGYNTARFTMEQEYLNIKPPEDNTIWWQCFEIQTSDLLWGDDDENEDDLAYLNELNPKGMFVIEYHANSLALMATMLSRILAAYGGIAQCRGRLRNAYTLETITDIVHGCP